MRNARDAVVLMLIGAGHSTNPQTIGYTRYIEAIRTFCGGNAVTAFPALFGDNHTVGWGSK